MSSLICPVDGCTKNVHRGLYCYAHYMKNWRYGTPTPSHPPRYVDIRGKRYGTLVVVQREGLKWICECDCGEQRIVSAGDLNRYGDKSTCGVPRMHLSDDASYHAAHRRLAVDRGPASSRSCVDCGRDAAHWSYNHDSEDELIFYDERSGCDIAYSIDQSAYDPRCVSCHKRFDMGRINSAVGGLDVSS